MFTMDNDEKNTNIDWLKADMTEVKLGLKEMNHKLDSFIIKDCPARHEKVDGVIDAMKQRITVLEVRVYIVVALALVAVETVIKKFFG